MSSTKLKKCFKCGEAKTFDNFWRAPRNTDGFMGMCKICHGGYPSQSKGYTSKPRVVSVHTKRCVRCSTVKTFDNFWKDGKGRDGEQRYATKCSRCSKKVDPKRLKRIGTHVDNN